MGCIFYRCLDCNREYSIVIRADYSTNCVFCHGDNIERIKRKHYDYLSNKWIKDKEGKNG